MVELDLLDRKILYELDLNARISASQLAKRFRKNKETVNFRINRLLKNNYIKNFYTIFNTSKLGWYYSKFYLKLKSLSPKKEKEIFEFLSAQPFVAYLASTEGFYDAVLLIMIKEPADLFSFNNRFMSHFGKDILLKDNVTFVSTHRFNQRFLYVGKKEEDWSYPLKLGNYQLTKKENKILNTISENARMPLTEIAKKTALDLKTVRYHLKKLEKEKIILAYTTATNFNQLGLQFIQINISLSNPNKRLAIIEFFRKNKNCLFAIETLGRFDLTIELHLKNNIELEGILNNFKEQFNQDCQEISILNIKKEYRMVWSPFQ